MIVAVVVLEHWRQLFRRGVPLSVAIESNLSVWKRCGEVMDFLVLFEIQQT